ncbi:MAG: universal stress protein [Desulfobacteraceae bacterium]|nr:universal stress protein [Desulfobacteraceae bacterium]
MKTSVLIAVNDSYSSRSVIDRFIRLPFIREEINITLIHVFRKPSISEELLGDEYMLAQLSKFKETLAKVKDKLCKNGFFSEKIKTRLVKEPYPTISAGLLDQFGQGKYNILVIGRRRMSKAEEFVMGDPSIKLVRTLENTSVLVVK